MDAVVDSPGAAVCERCAEKVQGTRTHLYGHCLPASASVTIRYRDCEEKRGNELQVFLKALSLLVLVTPSLILETAMQAFCP